MIIILMNKSITHITYISIIITKHHIKKAPQKCSKTPIKMAHTFNSSIPKVQHMHNNLVSQDKVKNLYKLHNVTGNNKIFDKELKSIAFFYLPAYVF